MSKRKRGKKRGDNRGDKDQQQAEPAAPANHAEDHEVAPAHRDTQQSKTAPEKPWRPPATLADWAIVAFTGVLTVVAIVQGCFMQKEIAQTQSQIRQTQITIERTEDGQKAWIAALPPEIETMNPNDRIRVQIPIKNSGQTPGFVQVHDVIIEIVDDDFWMPDVDDPTAYIGGREQWQNVVPANITVYYPGQSIFTLTKEQFDSVMGKTQLLWLHGGFVYTDVFGGWYYVRYCYKYDADKQQFLHYRKGNRMLKLPYGETEPRPYSIPMSNQNEAETLDE